jgi:hypothetical protein
MKPSPAKLALGCISSTGKLVICWARWTALKLVGRLEKWRRTPIFGACLNPSISASRPNRPSSPTARTGSMRWETARAGDDDYGGQIMFGTEPLGLRRLWTVSHGRLDHSRRCFRGRGRLAPTIRSFVTSNSVPLVRLILSSLSFFSGKGVKEILQGSLSGKLCSCARLISATANLHSHGAAATP